MNLDSMTEDEAFGLYVELRKRFGWKGAIFTKIDVASTLLMMSGMDDGDLPDRVWEAVQQSEEWNEWLTEQTYDRGWLIIERMLERITSEL